MTGTSAAIERQVEKLKRFNDRVLQLQQQLAQEKGDDEAAEEARHKKALEDAKEEATLDGSLNGAQFNELKRLENEIHEQRLKNIEKEKQARRDSTTRDADDETSTDSGGGGGQAPRASIQATTLNPVFNLYATVADPKTMDKFARDVGKILEGIAKRSR